METFKVLLGALVAAAGVISLIGGAIASKFWVFIIVVLSIIKIVGLAVMPWFAGITTVSAIGTGIWVLIVGLLMIVTGAIVMTIGKVLADQ